MSHIDIPYGYRDRSCHSDAHSSAMTQRRTLVRKVRMGRCNLKPVQPMELHLGGNQLKSLMAGLAGLTALEMLHLEGNLLSSFALNFNLRRYNDDANAQTRNLKNT